MIWIREVDSERITKDGGGLFEGNAVLAQVGCRFAGIPFEFVPHTTNLSPESRSGLCLLECADSQVATDGWKVVEELVERVSTLEVVEQSLKGHATSYEHGLPPKNIGVAVHSRTLGLH
jgi:hypothetical protein